MIFIKKSGKDCQVKSVNELFGSDKRKLRNELFEKQQAEKKANELMRDVDAMSQEQAQALLEKLQAKLAQ